MTTVEKDADTGRSEEDAAEVETDDAELWASMDEEEGDSTSPGDEPGDEEELDASPDDDTPAGDEPADDAADDDPFASATPEQKAAWGEAQQKIAKLEQSDRSNRGRLGAMQRQVNEMMAKAAAGDKPADAKERPAPEGSYLESNEYKEFAEEYPEVAGPFSKIIANLEKRLAVYDERFSAEERAEVDDAITVQTDLLTEFHPDWQEVLAADDKTFMEWLPSQPRHVQEAAYRNAEVIVDAEEAADVFSRFKAFRSANGAGNPSDTPANGRGDGKPRLTGKRQRQLESATGARSKGPGVATGIPEDGDEQALWDAWDKMDEREAQRA